MFHARPYQESLIAAVMSDLNAARDGLSEVVLAACPGAGKTFMSIEIVDRMIASGSARRVLVLAHGTTVLRSQYAGALAEEPRRFTWGTVGPGGDRLDDTAAQVVVTLPQSISRSDVAAAGFDLVVVDEAHQFYGASMVTSIVGRSGAKRVLLMTGTPSPFVARGLPLHAVSMQEVFRAGFIADAHVKLLQSHYDVKRKQYNDDGEIVRSVKFRRGQTTESLDDLLRFFRGHVAGRPSGGWKAAANALGKAMVVCRSQAIASHADRYFRAAGVTSFLSTSDTDDGSQIEAFKAHRGGAILVVVCRANLGFDFPELSTLVDMTGTINIDRIFQMFARVVRPSAGIAKTFVKLASADMFDYTRAILQASLLLAGRDLYVKWNGKDLNGVRVPVQTPAVGVANGSSVSAARPRLPKIDPWFMAFGDFLKTHADESGALISGTTLAAISASMGIQVRCNRDELLKYYANNHEPVKPGHYLYHRQSNMCSQSGRQFDKEVFQAAVAVGLRPRNHIHIDAIGRRFGRLTIESIRIEGNGRYGRAIATCRCECKNTIERPLFRMGHVRSCGCLVSDVARRLRIGARRINDEKLSQIKELRASGASLRELARKFRISISYASNLTTGLRRSGAQRSPSVPPPHRSPARSSIGRQAHAARRARRGKSRP